MPVDFVTTTPDHVEEEVVRYWSARGQFPDWGDDEHRNLWNWRYRALSDGPTLVCVARDRESSEVVGHVAVYRRNFEIDGKPIRVGLPGSLALRPEFQGGLAGAKLAGFPRQQLRDGAFDVVLGFSNLAAHALLTGTGARDLGPLSYHVDLRRSARFLGQRVPALASLAAPVDAALSIRRRWRRRAGLVRRSGLDVRLLTATEFRSLDRSHWVAPKGRVVSADSTEFVVRRYLECPYAPRQMYGLFDRGGKRLQGYAVTQGRERVEIWNCQLNSARLDLPSAFTVLSSVFADSEALTTSTSQCSELANDLARAGFVARPPSKSPTPERMLNATFLPENPLAASIDDFSRWDLWLGASQY